MKSKISKKEFLNEIKKIKHLYFYRIKKREKYCWMQNNL